MLAVIGGGVVVMIREMQVSAIVATVIAIAIVAVAMGISSHSVRYHTAQKYGQS